MIQDTLALRLVANEANRDRINGLGKKDRTAAQWVVEGELVDEGRHTFTTWYAYFGFTDKLTSFGAFFAIAGFLRLMKDKGAGAKV